MIDFIRLNVPYGYAKSMLSNPLLDFYRPINERTAEIKTVDRKGKEINPFQTAYLNGIQVKVYDNGRVIIQGSLHKYWNSGAHNFNDFNIVEVSRTIAHFISLFKIDPTHALINQLEIGININPPQHPKTILHGLFEHLKQPFEKTHTRTEGNYYQARHNNFILKTYDKGKQYRKAWNIKEELLRFEIKYYRTQLKRMGINTLQDLKEFPFMAFVEELVSRWNECLFFDFSMKLDSTNKIEYSNPNYWIQLRKNLSRAGFKKHRDKLRLMNQNEAGDIQNKIAEIIQQKALELTIGGKRINDISIVSNRKPNEVKCCLVTKLNIGMQRIESLLLSHTGIRYYKRYNYCVYLELELKFLTKRFINADSETRIRELAHQIRNTYYNSRHRIKASRKRNQLEFAF